MLRRTDARQHKDFRRRQSAGSQDDFLASPCFARCTVRVEKGDAGRRAVLSHELADRGARDHFEFPVALHGTQIGCGDRAAHSVALRDLIEAGALLDGAVEIVVVGITRFLRSAQTGEAQRMAKAGI